MRAQPIAGRYELVEQLSSGGMGTVWRGYDAVLDREVAVKLIRWDAVTSAEQAEEFAKRFRREARVTARIRHHGVPQVYDAVLESPNDTLYLVMELVHGTSLRAFIDPLRPLPIAWAAAVAAQICTVLSHAHAIPVVHRDLKPDNVLVTDEGMVKVLDFGIAAILRTDVTQLTDTGSLLGTTNYMSPEQIQAAQVTPHSDLYALGCVLHELLTGRPVFDGQAHYQRMRQHVSEPPPPLRHLRADAPEGLEHLVLELLAKTPEERPADTFEVYDRLLPFLPLPGSSPPSTGREPAGIPDPTLLYRRPNAPHPRPSATAGPAAPEEAPAPASPSAPQTGVREAMRSQIAEADALLDDERFTQAADILAAVIGMAGAAFGAESPRVLRLRARRAAILVVAGEFRRALPEFDALAAAYTRTVGPDSPDAVQCLRQAADCRAALGQATAAIRQFRQVLAALHKSEGDASEAALDVRKNIGILLLAEGEVAQALAVLQPLYDDLLVVQGPQHEHTQEVRDILSRIHLTEQ